MRTTVALILLLAFSTDGRGAQQAIQFTARLSPVPRTAATVATVTGSGTVTAVLDGATLTVAGPIAGHQSPATSARLHMGERTGVRGPAIFDLQVVGQTSGSVSATLKVSRVHIDSFERGQFYVQLHSQRAPEGNLWGWLLVEAPR
jgi:hypothetical protein